MSLQRLILHIETEAMHCVVEIQEAEALVNKVGALAGQSRAAAAINGVFDLARVAAQRMADATKLELDAAAAVDLLPSPAASPKPREESATAAPK